MVLNIYGVGLEKTDIEILLIDKLSADILLQIHHLQLTWNEPIVSPAGSLDHTFKQSTS
jgi:hypothetical protein